MPTPEKSPFAPSTPPPGSFSAPIPPKGFWPHGWWKIMETRIGVIPLPVYLVLAAIVAYYAVAGKLPTEICMMIGVMGLFGFACGELGKHMPVLRHLGAAAIFATFIPSFLVARHWLPPEVVKSVTDFTNSSKFLYLFISAVIVGSILGMDRRVLIQGFFKIFVPMAAGSILAAAVGTAVGSALGLGVKHTLFYIVVPIMAGGVGEGALPLSAGYGEILHQGPGGLVAQILPPVMFGSLVAILLSGILNFIGKKYPSLTGRGRLQPEDGTETDLGSLQGGMSEQIDVVQVAAAGSTAIVLYLVGLVVFRVSTAWGLPLPAPVVMLFLAVVLKLGHVIPPRLQQGAYVVYRFFATAVTYPLLFAIGVALTPWDALVKAFALPNLLTIASTVVTMTATGFFVARWINVYPIDMAIVNSCRCGQGGTGDVAILTAADRMQLMPFAQVATRIGGAITVTLALVAYARMHG
jgi:CCS family citrate carrier protein